MTRNQRFMAAGLALTVVMLTTGCGGAPGTPIASAAPGPSASDLRHAKQSEQDLRDRGFVDADSPTLSADERMAVDIAKKQVSGDPHWLYKVRHDARGWHVEAFMHNYIDSKGRLTVVGAGGFFNVYISDDWKDVKVVGGA